VTGRRFEGKTVLITGGSQGIGAATARRFAQEGARVGVVASRDLGKARGVADEIAAAGGKALPFACDVASVPQIDLLVGEVTAAFGRIDILVNSAGVFYPTRIGETNEEMFDRMCDINLKGCFFCCNAVAPQMIERGDGKIINVGSTAGVTGRSQYLVYSATKAGVIHLTRSLGVALAPHGINVNAIAPGNTQTPMNEDIRTAPEYAQIRKTIAERTPSRRPFADPDEIAGAALFLASDDARSMYGSVVTMDEGTTAGY
jgi:3-oxoacyl-[acyl-carrier protein] reductase